MEWVIVFIANWILFFLLVDWKKLKLNIWCGILAVALQFAVDVQAINLGWYEVNDKVIPILGSSVFFVIGPVLVIGTLIAQYHPKKRWLQVVNVLVFAVLYSIFELMVVARGALVYHNWDYGTSLVVNTGVMAILSWFTIVVLDQKGEITS